MVRNKMPSYLYLFIYFAPCAGMTVLGMGGCRDQGGTVGGTEETAAEVGSVGVMATAPAVSFARLMVRRDFEGALVVARRTAADRPTDPGAFLDLASAAAATGRQEEALDAVRAGIRFEPERAGGYVIRGVIQEARGDLREAERSWLEALDRNPSASESKQARMMLAGLARARQAYLAEESLLRAALDLTPDDTDLRAMLALCLVAQGRADDARQMGLQVVARDPRRFEVQRLLAALAWDREDYPEALERGAIAVRLDDGDEVARRLLEGAFYVVTTTRLRCQHGERPWSEDAVITVLREMESDFAMEGAATFVELDLRFKDDAGVQGRLAAAAAVACGVRGAGAP